MKWYHYIIFASIACVIVAIEKRIMIGQASIFYVIASIPGLVYISIKLLEKIARVKL